MFPLDMRTVLFSYNISSALCALVMFALWRQSRGQPGVALWMADFVMQFVGLLLIALRGVIPDLLSMVVANLLIIGGTLALLIGLERYADRVSSQRLNYFYLTGFAVIQTWFALMHPSLQARNLNIAIGLAIFCGQCAWLLLHRAAPDMRRHARPLGLTFLAFVLVSIIRILIALAIPPSADFLGAGPYETLSILIYQMLYIGMTFALVLLVNRRLQAAMQADMAAREQANAALKASEEKFASAFRTSPYAITITRAADGQIIDVNDAFVAITGISRAEALAATTLSLNVWADPADRGRVIDALRAGQPVVNWEIEFRRKHGAVFPGSISAQVTQLGDAPHILSSVEDITARKQGEAARARQARLTHFRAEANEALNSIADLDAALQVCAEAAVRHLDAAFARIWLLDPNEELLTLHASAGLYTHRDGAHGHIPVGQFKIGIIAAARQPFLTNAVATDPQISDPAWAQQEGMVAFAGYPLLAGGRLVGVLALFAQQPLPEDTLDALATIATTIANGVARRQAEQALQASEADLARSNTDLERFAYVVSHDLQEPLRMVSLFVDLLGQEYRGKLDANADEYIRYAVEGAKRMHRQIQDLLAYSRIETHGAPLHPTDATDAFTGALWNLDTAIADAAAVVTHDPLPMVLADPPQLTLLFQNLIGNAIKFRSEAPPCIHIAVRRLAGQDTAAPAWEFAVRDNGIGIEPQYRERIFGVFQRLHTQQAYPGTGIGLAICQRIVERHGGRIWVESEEGQGATFFFTLVPAEPA